MYNFEKEVKYDKFLEINHQINQMRRNISNTDKNYEIDEWDKIKLINLIKSQTADLISDIINSK